MVGFRCYYRLFFLWNTVFWSCTSQCAFGLACVSISLWQKLHLIAISRWLELLTFPNLLWLMTQFDFRFLYFKFLNYSLFFNESHSFITVKVFIIFHYFHLFDIGYLWLFFDFLPLLLGNPDCFCFFQLSFLLLLLNTRLLFATIFKLLLFLLLVSFFEGHL